MTSDKEPDRNEELMEREDRDDLLDGVLREIVSREVAKKEGRDEGGTVVFEPRPGNESVVVGRREDLDRFHEVLQEEQTRYREVEVDRFPTNPEKIAKLQKMIIPRLSRANERLGLTGPPIVAGLVKRALESAEDMASSLGIPIEEKTEECDSGEHYREELDKTLDGFKANFRPEGGRNG